MFSTRGFGEIPNLCLSHHVKGWGQEHGRGTTYVFDALTSSIFLWKGCCVGVAADTETVDELCMLLMMCGAQQRNRNHLP
jgi:hypothetical protein